MGDGGKKRRPNSAAHNSERIRHTTTRIESPNPQDRIPSPNNAMTKMMTPTLTVLALAATANAFVVPQSSPRIPSARGVSALGLDTLQQTAPSNDDSSSHWDATTRSPTSAANQDTTTLGTLQVPSVGIGTISWSSENLFKLENKQLQSIVGTACRSDAAFFDTAERYGSHIKTALGLGWGETESLTQQMLRRAATNNDDGSSSHHQAVIATKFTPSPWRTSVDSVLAACQQSRERLGVDQIDLYQIHMPDIVQPLRFLGKEQVKDEIYWDGLAECYHRGLVKNVGVCNYGVELVTRAHEALAKRGVPLASNQIAYSLIGRHNGAQETVDKCHELGIQVLGYYPFAMGLLTGKYSSQMTPSIQGQGSSKKTKLEERDLNRYAQGMDPLLEVMQTIAEQRGKTVAQVALNYVICKGVIPIPGANSEKQLVDNIGAMGWRLSKDEVQLLETTADSLGIGFDGAGFKRTSEKFVGYGVEKFSLV